MINLDERYHNYLDGSKKLRIDGVDERLNAYGWHCDGNEIKGYYLTTENYKLFYNMNEQFIKAITIAIDKKMITADQGFEIIREQSVERTNVVNETIGFNQKR